MRTPHAGCRSIHRSAGDRPHIINSQNAEWAIVELHPRVGCEPFRWTDKPAYTARAHPPLDIMFHARPVERPAELGVGVVHGGVGADRLGVVVVEEELPSKRQPLQPPIVPKRPQASLRHDDLRDKLQRDAVPLVLVQQTILVGVLPHHA